MTSKTTNKSSDLGASRRGRSQGRGNIAITFGPWHLILQGDLAQWEKGEFALKLRPSDVGPTITDSDLDALFRIEDRFQVGLTTDHDQLSVSGILGRKNWDREGLELWFEVDSVDRDAYQVFYDRHLQLESITPLDRSFAIFGHRALPTTSVDTVKGLGTRKLWDL